MGKFTIKRGVLIQYEGRGGTIIIPDGVTEICDRAFSKCFKLTQSIFLME
ncbi:MAG: hypothetical protein IJ899_05135 [Blautia sp.]|nr:hypothetical protein [Blautia sp.]